MEDVLREAQSELAVRVLTCFFRLSPSPVINAPILHGVVVLGVAWHPKSSLEASRGRAGPPDTQDRVSPCACQIERRHGCPRAHRLAWQGLICLMRIRLMRTLDWLGRA